MIKTKERFTIDYCDPSSLSCFGRCPAKYLFERLMGLSDPSRDMIAPDYGTCMHRALPYAYLGADNLDIDKAYQEFDRAWENYSYGWRDEKRNPDTARISLDSFAMQRSPQMCQYDILPITLKEKTADIISPNEVPFLIDIGGPLSLAGRIDLMMRYRDTGDVWVDDYKTASEISPRFFNNFTAGCQACGYTLAGTHITGERVRGLAIEAIRTAKPGTKNSGQIELNFIFVTDVQLEQFVEAANHKSEEILGCNKYGEWPQENSACAPYAQFGMPGYLCPFRALCDRGDDWEDQVRFYKRSKPFHPFYVNTEQR